LVGNSFNEFIVRCDVKVANETVLSWGKKIQLYYTGVSLIAMHWAKLVVRLQEQFYLPGLTI